MANYTKTTFTNSSLTPFDPVSIGSTRIFSDEVPIVILGRADQALYYAKENGRNMVCNYESLITKGALHDNAPYKSDVDFF